jgi:predicted AlkP superfamily pyrophosphatase or phosphodiesterase
MDIASGFRNLFVVAALVAAMPPGTARAQDQERPAVVALVVVDQLPPYLLEKYDTLFTGGFRRLLDGGYRFTQASHAYAQTHTAAGHTTLSTGVVPARHGIVANGWREMGERDWEGIVSVGDPSVSTVGVAWAEGRSPANNRRDGLPDWLQAQHDDAVVLSISAKDRSAIGLAARAKGQVFWINTYEGRFVTSTYYVRRDPLWIQAFNRLEMPDFYKDTVWTSSVPDEWAGLSRQDTVPYENDGVHTSFPHRYHQEADTEEAGALNYWVSGTPTYDQATIAAAVYGMKQLKMGQDDVPDYLAVSLSQTDIVGHAFGPHSREQLDNLLRLDQELAKLLDGLDETVGAGRWTLVLTSDHGALPMPEQLQEWGTESRRTTLAELQEMIVAARRAEIEDDGDGTVDRIAEALRPFPLAEQVFTGPQLLNEEPADSFAVLYARSYYPGRSVGYFGDMDVLVRFPERVIPTTGTMGTDHRSGYWYDRHVPLVLYGAGIEEGESDEPVRAVDVAPTLAAMIGVDAPDDLDGRVIYPVPEP